MLYALAALVGLAAFIVLMRLLWLANPPQGARSWVLPITVILLLSLGLLTASGRLHWLAALITGALPFLRALLRLSFNLLRWLPLLRGLTGAAGQQQSHGQSHRPGAANSSSMSREQALEVLGLTNEPSRDEIVQAHRRLMQRVHPDRGGSTYLAQQLNEAKRVLLQRS